MDDASPYYPAPPQVFRRPLFYRARGCLVQTSAHEPEARFRRPSIDSCQVSGVDEHSRWPEIPVPSAGQNRIAHLPHAELDPENHVQKAAAGVPGRAPGATEIVAAGEVPGRGVQNHVIQKLLQ